MGFGVVIHEIRALFGDASQRQRMILVALLLGIAGCIAMLAMAGARTFPVKRTEIVTVERVVKVRREFIPVPSGVKYPRLADPKAACHGAPVVIVRMTVSQSTTDKGNDTHTWLTVRPAGDAYTVQCTMAGDQSRQWAEGDLIALVTGDVSG